MPAQPIMIGRRGPMRSTRRPPSDMPTAVNTAGTKNISPTFIAVKPRRLSQLQRHEDQPGELRAHRRTTNAPIARRNARCSNMRSSISGWSVRSSWRVNTASDASPPPMHTTVAGERQPHGVALGDAEDGDRQADAAEHQPGDVERPPLAVADVGQQPEAGDERGGADRDVDRGTSSAS